MWTLLISSRYTIIASHRRLTILPKTSVRFFIASLLSWSKFHVKNGLDRAHVHILRCWLSKAIQRVSIVGRWGRFHVLAIGAVPTLVQPLDASIMLTLSSITQSSRIERATWYSPFISQAILHSYDSIGFDHVSYKNTGDEHAFVGSQLMSNKSLVTDAVYRYIVWMCISPRKSLQHTQYWHVWSLYRANTGWYQ